MPGYSLGCSPCLLTGLAYPGSSLWVALLWVTLWVLTLGVSSLGYSLGSLSGCLLSGLLSGAILSASLSLLPSLRVTAVTDTPLRSPVYRSVTIGVPIQFSSLVNSLGNGKGYR